MAISRNTPRDVFTGIEKFLKDPSIKTKDESSKVRMKYVFSAPDRMALAAQIHENFDKMRLDYSRRRCQDLVFLLRLYLFKIKVN